MLYETKTNEWNREARRAAEIMAAFRTQKAIPASKEVAGYMLVIGDQLKESSAIFLGWAPDGGVADLLRLVQFGSPYHLAVLAYLPATVQDVEDHRAALKQFKYRTDDTTWFMRSPNVENYIEQLRKSVYAENDDIDLDVSDRPLNLASTLLPAKPARKPKQASTKPSKARKARRKANRNKQAKKQRR